MRYILSVGFKVLILESESIRVTGNEKRLPATIPVFCGD
ncbi:hypothetical protein ACIN5065_1072 [Acinetobacter baumannii OIFC065]|nr:hypothetical protein ACINIS123_2402 [Acinetobacter baumannii IS-123]EJP57350.1 hypothetical protein ACINNAV81_1704 [Acinetobacter baumannii Naval-81]EKA67792.1 hypothetical protein ACINIS116_2845 [Acinetobacter baumannii IS-116]EKP36455.1 hypothetical protein ACIN5065_1072 [Acinetobacter baumannii OIFC065]